MNNVFEECTITELRTFALPLFEGTRKSLINDK